MSVRRKLDRMVFDLSKRLSGQTHEELTRLSAYNVRLTWGIELSKEEADEYLRIKRKFERTAFWHVLAVFVTALWRPSRLRFGVRLVWHELSQRNKPVEIEVLPDYNRGND